MKLSIKMSNCLLFPKHIYLASIDSTIHMLHLMEHSTEIVLTTDLITILRFVSLPHKSSLEIDT